MAEARYFCPNCGSTEIQVRGSREEIKLRGQLKGLAAHCELCGWAGKVEELLGAATTGSFYDIKRVANILLGVTSKHAAGPLAQAFEVVGLLQENDQEGRNFLMRRLSEALIRTSFESAAEWAKTRAEALKDPHNLDDGLRQCPHCKEDVDHPYVHACGQREEIVHVRPIH